MAHRSPPGCNAEGFQCEDSEGFNPDSRAHAVNETTIYYVKTFQLERFDDGRLFGGVRAGVSFAGVRADAEWAVGKRWNFFFQNFSTAWFDRDNAVNVVNHTLRLRLSVAP